MQMLMSIAIVVQIIAAIAVIILVLLQHCLLYTSDAADEL